MSVSRAGMLKLVVAIVALFAIGIGLMLHEKTERKSEAARLREFKLEPQASELAVLAGDGRPALALMLRELRDRARTGTCQDLTNVVAGLEAITLKERVREHAVLDKRLGELVAVVLEICKRED